MDEYPPAVNELIVDYVTDYTAHTPHPLKRHAFENRRRGRPFNSRQIFIRRRLVDIIGETKTDKLLKSTLQTFNLLKG